MRRRQNPPSRYRPSLTRPGATMRASKGLFALLAFGFATVPAGAGTPGSGAAQHSKQAVDGEKTFRVCADPNNLPFSNKSGEGFENKLAQMIADELGAKVTYAWHAQRRGFIRQTLKAKLCDVVMGEPKRMEMVETTKPYYRAGYVFVSRADRHLDIKSIKDPRLRKLRIGVQVIGDDGFNTPPSHALAAQGMVDNLVGYTVYGDYREPNPPERIIEGVKKGDVDIAAVWGPMAGFFANRSDVPLVITPISDGKAFRPFPFHFDIAMAVRHGDHARRAMLDDFITRRQSQIKALLADFGIPTLQAPVKASRAAGRHDDDD
jgi:mxaJ protein